jgi:peptidoglycan/LPS O-acetylase OafA/YrhL
VKYRSDIDGLRAIAVGLVLLFHAGLGVSGGYIGVDVFFVISGYLITRSILDGHRDGTFTILRFYDHRVRRILPALFAMLAATTVWACVWLMPRELNSYGGSLIAAASFASNLFFWKTTNYFLPDAHELPLLHTWSLGVEEQFYIAYPLILVWFLKSRPSHRAYALGAMAVASFALSAVLATRAPTANFYMLPTRAWELLAGALLTQARPPGRAWLSTAAGVLGVGMIVWSALVMNASTPFPGPWAVPAVLGSALIIYAGMCPTQGLASKLLSTPPFRFIGLVSYSLYLWHWPILVAFRAYAERAPQPLEAAGLLLVTLVISTLSWRYVERPFRRKDPRGRAWLAPSVGVAAIAVTAVVGTTFIATLGWPERLAPATLRLAAMSDSRDPVAETCHDRSAAHIAAGDMCVIGAPGAPRTWLLWGDSHGWALQRAFSAYLDKHGQAGFVMTQLGCPPLVGYRSIGTSSDCRSGNDAVMKYARSHGVTDILLASTWTNWFMAHDRFVDQDTTERSVAESQRVLAKSLDMTLAELNAAGIRVWVLDPLPQAKAAVPETMADNLRWGRNTDVRYSWTEYARRNRLVMELFADNDARIYGRFSLQNELCRTGMCAVSNAAGPLYMDNNHPAAAQSDYFRQLMERNLHLGERATAPESSRSAAAGVVALAER